MQNTTRNALNRVISDPKTRRSLEQLIAYLRNRSDLQETPEDESLRLDLTTLEEALSSFELYQEDESLNEIQNPVVSMEEYGIDIAFIEGELLEVTSSSKPKELYAPIDNSSLAFATLQHLTKKMDLSPREVLIRAIALLSIAHHAISEGKKIGIAAPKQKLETEIEGI